MGHHPDLHVSSHKTYTHFPLLFFVVVRVYICISACMNVYVWQKCTRAYVCFEQVFLCDLWRSELLESLLPLDPKSIRADVTLDSWHSMRSFSLSLCWPSEWQLWGKGGNELRAKEVRPIKIRLDASIGVGTVFSLQICWPTGFSEHSKTQNHVWMESQRHEPEQHSVVSNAAHTSLQFRTLSE